MSSNKKLGCVDEYEVLNFIILHFNKVLHLIENNYGDLKLNIHSNNFDINKNHSNIKNLINIHV